MTDDAATALLQAIGASFAGIDAVFRVQELSSRSWASVTFSGARHRVTFCLEGAVAGSAADAFVTQMSEAEFDLDGHILADIALLGADRSPSGDRVQLRLEALTVEDR